MVKKKIKRQLKFSSFRAIMENRPVTFFNAYNSWMANLEKMAFLEVFDRAVREAYSDDPELISLFKTTSITTSNVRNIVHTDYEIKEYYDSLFTDGCMKRALVDILNDFVRQISDDKIIGMVKKFKETNDRGVQREVNNLISERVKDVDDKSIAFIWSVTPQKRRGLFYELIKNYEFSPNTLDNLSEKYISNAYLTQLLKRFKDIHSTKCPEYECMDRRHEGSGNKFPISYLLYLMMGFRYSFFKFTKSGTVNDVIYSIIVNESLSLEDFKLTRKMYKKGAVRRSVSSGNIDPESQLMLTILQVYSKTLEYGVSTSNLYIEYFGGSASSSSENIYKFATLTIPFNKVKLFLSNNNKPLIWYSSKANDDIITLYRLFARVLLGQESIYNLVRMYRFVLDKYQDNIDEVKKFININSIINNRIIGGLIMGKGKSSSLEELAGMCGLGLSFLCGRIPKVNKFNLVDNVVRSNNIESFSQALYKSVAMLNRLASYLDMMSTEDLEEMFTENSINAFKNSINNSNDAKTDKYRKALINAVKEKISIGVFGCNSLVSKENLDKLNSDYKLFWKIRNIIGVSAYSNSLTKINLNVKNHVRGGDE